MKTINVTSQIKRAHTKIAIQFLVISDFYNIIIYIGETETGHTHTHTKYYILYLIISKYLYLHHHVAQQEDYLLFNNKNMHDKCSEIIYLVYVLQKLYIILSQNEKKKILHQMICTYIQSVLMKRQQIHKCSSNSKKNK